MPWIQPGTILSAYNPEFTKEIASMPRRHKGPPKESIDSILQVMSTRVDIDPDTLSYYFDRLDEEWTNGARDKVLQLLRTGDAKAQTSAMQILTELATNFDLEELEDFV